MLNPILLEVVSSLYPQILLTTYSEFQPMLDLSKGDLSSTAAVEIARQTRENADLIARRIIEEISKKVVGEWRSDQGYIVLAQASAAVLLPEAKSLAELFPAYAKSGASSKAELREVICLVPDLSVPVYARLRLIASTALQALLTVVYEGGCRLSFVPLAPRIVRSKIEVLEQMRLAVERCLAHEGEARLDILDVFELSSNGTNDPLPAAILTAHHYHERLSERSKSYLAEQRKAGRCNLRMPSDAWLISRDRALSELLNTPSMRAVIGELRGDDGWMRWIFHAASSIPSGDFDPAVALFDECASPLWNVQVLIERFRQLCASPLSGVDRNSLAGITGIDQLLKGSRERDLALRCVFMPLWIGRAIRNGGVLEWITVLEELASRGHAFLNRPQTRIALAQGRDSQGTTQIAASLALGLSSILPVVSGGVCVDQL